MQQYNTGTGREGGRGHLRWECLTVEEGVLFMTKLTTIMLIIMLLK